MKKISEKNFKLYYLKHAVFFCGTRIISYQKHQNPFINFKDGLDFFSEHVQGVFLSQNILFVELEKIKASPLFTHYSSKAFLSCIFTHEMTTVLRGIQWLTWNKRTNHCSQCGNTIVFIQGTTEKKCNHCHLSFYPSLSPAVMVLIQKENKLLLARSHHFRPGMYSALAGFVDIGETAEQAVHRETMEEIGLKITSLKYFGSQSWPFPSSFMIAFTAEYLDGEITIDQNELEDAQWFDSNNLPNLPPMPSISRMLINSIILQ